MNHNKIIQILLIEDNPGDIYLMTSELKQLSISNKLHVAVDGQEAMDFLEAVKNKDRHAPDVIILDLNLPRVDGREVFECIKSDPLLREVPLIIVSASDEQAEFIQKYNQGTNAFIKKTNSLKSFHLLIEEVNNFIQRNIVKDNNK
jgi:CheY-like chemotaxis protein